MCTKDVIYKITFIALWKVYLTHNHLTRLPDLVRKAPALVGLFVDNNDFTCLPDFSVTLDSLNEIDFSHNKLDNCKHDFEYNTRLPSFLFFVYLGYNDLTYIPDLVVKASNLRQLFLGISNESCNTTKNIIQQALQYFKEEIEQTFCQIGQYPVELSQHFI